MISFYKSYIPIINDDPATRLLAYPMEAAFGGVPRDYDKYPEEMFDDPNQLRTYSESEWDALYDEQEARQSSLEHIFLNGPNGGPAFVNLDQDGDGYCWGYSVGQAIMMNRLASGQPLIRLSAHGPCAIIKRGRNEGGWCGLSAKFAREHGYPSVEVWPEQSRSLSHDTPLARANMALHKVTEDYVDLTKDVYDQNLSRLQLATCLFNNYACPTDYNWWAHSVCAIRWVRIEAGSWGILILNSWKGWGRHGLGVLQGSKAKVDGAVCVRSSGISVV